MVGLGKSSKGIFVIGFDEIVVYGLNKEVNLNDGFLVFLVDVLSMMYYIVMYWFFIYKMELLVVGIYDSMIVMV